jgi:hypothetical protein
MSTVLGIAADSVDQLGSLGVYQPGSHSRDQGIRATKLTSQQMG